MDMLVQRFDEKRRYWVQFAADFAALRTDPTAWAEEVHERSIWDGTLMDGLLDENIYEDQRLVSKNNPHE